MCAHCVAGKWQGLVKCWPADAVRSARSPRRRKHERGGGAGRHPALQLLGKRALESGKCVSIFRWDCLWNKDAQIVCCLCSLIAQDKMVHI